jgi:catechol 2,3-dioxygenase-like lactoylglutathione lyase family enzyme
MKSVNLPELGSGDMSEESVDFVCAVPVLLARDLEATIDFYTRLLGFKLDFRHGEPTSYVGFSRGNAFLHYAAAAPVGGGNSVAWRPGMQPADVNFFVRDVDALHEEFRQRGAAILAEPKTQSYGIRDLDVRDPNGYVLRFNQILHGGK